MKRSGIVLVGGVVLLLWMGMGGCTVGFDTEPPNEFYCESDADCIQPQFECSTSSNRCVRQGRNNNLVVCTDLDVDGDGYTVDGHPSCANPGKVDCNDDDDAVNPGATERCDGKDNDCDMETDEPVLCEEGDISGCPSGPSDTIPSCQAGSCVLKPLLSGSCDVTLSCVGGEVESLADKCP